MRVHIERTNKDKELTYSGSAQELCDELEINPQTVLIIRNGQLVTEDEHLEDDDEIKLVTVVSGG